MATTSRNKGLDYFPLRTDFPLQKEYAAIKEEFGMKGLCVAIYLVGGVYSEGYFAEWDTVRRRMSLLLPEVPAAVLRQYAICFSKRALLFDSNLLITADILTSPAIQLQFFEATAATRPITRAQLEALPFLLLSPEQIETLSRHASARGKGNYTPRGRKKAENTDFQDSNGNGEISARKSTKRKEPKEKEKQNKTKDEDNTQQLQRAAFGEQGADASPAETPAQGQRPDGCGRPSASGLRPQDGQGAAREGTGASPAAPRLTDTQKAREVLRCFLLTVEAVTADRRQRGKPKPDIAMPLGMTGERERTLARWYDAVPRRDWMAYWVAVCNSKYGNGHKKGKERPGFDWLMKQDEKGRLKMLEEPTEDKASLGYVYDYIARRSGKQQEQQPSKNQIL